jgi:hypothetical protein
MSTPLNRRKFAILQPEANAIVERGLVSGPHKMILKNALVSLVFQPRLSQEDR